MPSVRDMRRRIRSVQNTGKVTNAMSLIAASKMRRAQQAVTQGRPFADKIQEIITHLAAQPGDDEVSALSTGHDGGHRNRLLQHELAHHPVQVGVHPTA